MESDRISACPLGLDPVFKPADDPLRLADWKKRIGIAPENRYVIAHTGHLERKNLLGIISAIHAIRQEPDQKELFLVFTGGEKNLKKEFESRIPRFIDWKKFVRFTGQIRDEEFPILYSGADLMVFLSLAEGFGLPPLEAMACGLPVVCSNRTSMPEITGSAAILVDPADSDGVVDNILKVLRSDFLRNELKTRGLKRAEQLTWEAARPHLKKIWDHALAS
ncbi:MAG: glycosyltransferase family 1 protein [Luteolibacter sp.]